MKDSGRSKQAQQMQLYPVIDRQKKDKIGMSQRENFKRNES